MVKNPQVNAGDLRDASSIPRSGRSSGEGNGNPLWYSCLKSYRQRSLAGYSQWDHKQWDTAEATQHTHASKTLTFNMWSIQRYEQDDLYSFIFTITFRSFCVHWTYGTHGFTPATSHVLFWTGQVEPLLPSLSSLHPSLGSCSNLLLWLREKVPFYRDEILPLYHTHLYKFHYSNFRLMSNNSQCYQFKIYILHQTSDSRTTSFI